MAQKIYTNKQKIKFRLITQYTCTVKIPGKINNRCAKRN